jgi:hypothetical protein
VQYGNGVSRPNRQVCDLLHSPIMLQCVSPFMADTVEKVPSLKSLQICQNTIDIFDRR